MKSRKITTKNLDMRSKELSKYLLIRSNGVMEHCNVDVDPLGCIAVWTCR
jgi:hypothetical protein